jgi:hypothetical protein
MRAFLGTISVLLLSIASAAAAQVCQPATIELSKISDARTKFLVALAMRESSLDPWCVNWANYLGLFQMGEPALIDVGFYTPRGKPKGNDWIGQFTDRARFIGVSSTHTYLEQAGSQEVAVRAYHDGLWRRIHGLGLDNHIGETIGGIKLSKSGMTAGAHLTGLLALQDFIDSNGSDTTRDANGTSIAEYIKLFGGYY